MSLMDEASSESVFWSESAESVMIIKKVIREKILHREEQWLWVWRFVCHTGKTLITNKRYAIILR